MRDSGPTRYFLSTHFTGAVQVVTRGEPGRIASHWDRKVWIISNIHTYLRSRDLHSIQYGQCFQTQGVSLGVSCARPRVGLEDLDASLPPQYILWYIVIPADQLCEVSVLQTTNSLFMLICSYSLQNLLAASPDGRPILSGAEEQQSSAPCWGLARRTGLLPPRHAWRTARQSCMASPGH